jgi:hypothetical protein
MFDLPKRWKAILDAVIDAPVAWQTPGMLAAALGWDVDEATDLLCTLDVEGWIVVWETDEGPLITLSPLGAERLNVHLVEIGRQEIPRWARPDDPTPPLPRAKRVSWSARNASLHRLIAPDAAPEVSAEFSEVSENLRVRARSLGLKHRIPTRVEDLPPPGGFLGLGPKPWPGPLARGANAVCPVCGDQPLSPHLYCLYCDRWGMDEMLALVCRRAALAARISKPPGPCRSRLAPASPHSEVVFPLVEERHPREPGSCRERKARIKRERARRRARQKANRHW